MDVCKSHKKSTGFNIEKWEALATGKKIWRTEMSKVLLAEEQYITQRRIENREEAQFVCQIHTRICKSRIVPFSHSKRCTQPKVRLSMDLNCVLKPRECLPIMCACVKGNLLRDQLTIGAESVSANSL